MHHGPMILCEKMYFRVIFNSFFMHISDLQDPDIQMYTVLIINVVVTLSSPH